MSEAPISAEPEATPASPAALATPFAAIDAGLEGSHSRPRARDVAAIPVDRRPPAGDDERLAGIPDRTKGGF